MMEMGVGLAKMPALPHRPAQLLRFQDTGEPELQTSAQQCWTAPRPRRPAWGSGPGRFSRHPEGLRSCCPSLIPTCPPGGCGRDGGHPLRAHHCSPWSLGREGRRRQAARVDLRGGLLQRAGVPDCRAPFLLPQPPGCPAMSRVTARGSWPLDAGSPGSPPSTVLAWNASPAGGGIRTPSLHPAWRTGACAAPSSSSARQETQKQTQGATEHELLPYEVTC